MSSRHSLNTPEKTWVVETEDILKVLKSEKESGLTSAEVQKRLE